MKTFEIETITSEICKRYDLRMEDLDEFVNGPYDDEPLLCACQMCGHGFFSRKDLAALAAEIGCPKCGCHEFA